MVSTGPGRAQSPLEALAQQLEGHPQRRQIERALVALLQLSRRESGVDEWRLITGAISDINDALEVFRPHRQTRKITVFGSARTVAEDPCYALAEELARLGVEAGFEVMTGAGGGIMEAANRGAGCDRSIGLNVDLPFEQHPNRYVSGCEGRLLHFRYFFTRKLFFLRESDALVVLPGGFGTLDELFESLTLIQTGRTPPMPLVLLAPPGDGFWRGWRRIVERFMRERGLISPEDSTLVLEAGDAAGAVAHISRFYRVFNTARLAEDRIELVLNGPVGEEQLAVLNHRFDDLVDEGVIQASETVDDAGLLRPCLRFHFDKRRIGRLYQLLDHLNGLDLPASEALAHPGQRQLCNDDPPQP
ncbi:MAG: LOG family protein [Synechococcaceae cyanobacterium]|nr:LOG family protein [Synechococcaceae cyanobacterium]